MTWLGIAINSTSKFICRLYVGPGYDSKKPKPMHFTMCGNPFPVNVKMRRVGGQNLID